MSYTFNRQPHFKTQAKNQLCGWIYGLYTDVPGDFIRKPMKECTGMEICEEWLYHMCIRVWIFLRKMDMRHMWSAAPSGICSLTAPRPILI